jgi:hypothetical protein
MATIGAILAALLPLGSSGVQAAGSNRTSASALLRDACRASFSASAFRAQGHIAQGGTSFSGVDLYFGSAGELITLTEHRDRTASFIVNGPSTYLEANRAFWLSASNSATASRFAGRWLDITSDKKDIAPALTKGFNKSAALSSCGEGSASYAGKATVNGVKVTKVHQASSQGSDTYYIENGPTRYILRDTQSGKTSEDLVLSNYGVQPDLAAPPDAIPIS